MLCKCTVVSVITVLCLQFFLQKKLSLESRKPLQPDNTMHHDDEDACSVASSYPFVVLFFFDQCYFLLELLGVSLVYTEPLHLYEE